MTSRQARNLSDRKIVILLTEARNYAKSDGYPEIIRILENELARREY